MNPLVHYLVDGAREGRDPGPEFNTRWYVAENADVLRSGVNPLVHYVRHGYIEGRRPAPESVTTRGLISTKEQSRSTNNRQSRGMNFIADLTLAPDRSSC